MYSEELLEWVTDLGIEVVLAKRREDLKQVGLHIVNPTVAELVQVCYEALVADVKTVLVYLKPIGEHL